MGRVWGGYENRHCVVRWICRPGWSGLGAGQLYVNRLDQGYDLHTRAAEAALVRGDAKAAAGEAVAAMHGRDLPFIAFDNSRATALLRDALMAGQAPLIETGTKAFPRFAVSSDEIPENAAVGSDGKRLMILHNEDRAHPIFDIYALPSGRLLRSFPQQEWSGDTFIGAVDGFSPDLATTIFERIDGVDFYDSDTGRTVLPDFKAPAAFYKWTVSNDRRLVTATDLKKLRIWDLGASAAVTDLPFGGDGDGDEFHVAPGGRMAVTGAFPAGGPMSRSVIDLSQKTGAQKAGAPQKVRLRWTSNGPIDLVFSQDGRYVVTSVITGETPDHLSWTYGTRVWDLRSRQPVGPEFGFGNPETAQTLFQGRIMVITAMDGARFFDLETGRLLGPAITLPSATGESSIVTESVAYAVDWHHVLFSYRLNPILAMPVAALRTEACRRWKTCG